MRQGWKYHLRDQPDLHLVIRSDYVDCVLGTLRYKDSPVLGRIKIKVDHLEERWKKEK